MMRLIEWFAEFFRRRRRRRMLRRRDPFLYK